MARPKKDPSTKRTEQVSVALSPIELAAIYAKATKAQTNPTAFVRDAALGKAVSIVESTAPDFITRNELRAIGVNLNQIAKALNSGQQALPASLVQCCEKLDTLFDQWLSHDTQSRPRHQL